MKNYFKPALLIFMILTACEDDSSVLTNDENFAANSRCFTGQSISEIEWLQAEIQQIEQSFESQYFYISEGLYFGTIVILLENCCPYCNTITPVYNCKGELLGYVGNGQDDIKIELIKSQRLLWRPTNFACSF